MRPKAYVWRRHFSWDQLEKCRAIKKMRRRFMPGELAEKCRFARCQLQDTNKWDNVHRAFDGVWDGRPVDFDFVIRPLFAKYAVAIYDRVLADALEYYPNFMRYDVVDGSFVGERRIVFPDQLDEAACYWMLNRAWDLMESRDIVVAESCTVALEPESACAGGRRKATVELYIDRTCVDQETHKEVAFAMAAGQPFPTDPKPRACDAGITMEMFTELSQPELILLNWDRVRKRPSPVDQMLHDAVARFDLNAVKTALADGADPNSLPDTEGADTPLASVVAYKHCQRHERSGLSWDQLNMKYPGPSSEETIQMIDALVGAGGAVNWAGPNQCTPLAEAALNSDAMVLRRLLDLGADPSIRCFDDDSLHHWGTAWDYAHYRFDDNANNDDKTMWDAMCAKWPLPFGNPREAGSPPQQGEP